eukprot:3104790-Rhodomonas_salina.1
MPEGLRFGSGSVRILRRWIPTVSTAHWGLAARDQKAALCATPSLRLSLPLPLPLPLSLPLSSGSAFTVCRRLAVSDKTYSGPVLVLRQLSSSAECLRTQSLRLE